VSFLSKIGKGLGKVVKKVGTAIGGGLKAVSNSGLASLLPGGGLISSGAGFLGKLLAPEKAKSEPLQGSASSTAKQSGSFYNRIVKPQLPTYSNPLTALQKTVFPATSAVAGSANVGGYDVSWTPPLRPPDYNANGGADTGTKKIPVWVWFASGAFGFVSLLYILMSGRKRRR
jgi:hypothetical protein